MNVLLLASRNPWPPYSGDRLRTTVWLEALAPHARVALVAPDAPEFPVRRSMNNALRGAVRTLREGLPWQSFFAAPYAWSEAIARARREVGPFDATVVILSRLAPWIHDAEGVRILDAIDSLEQNMRERARESSMLTRWLWRAEERRLRRTDIAHDFDTVIFVSEDDARERGGVAISNGVAVRPLETRERKYDFGFWGRLAYFANGDAARFLIRDIWPAIRALRPHATLVIAGADAPPSLRLDAERAGVTLLSPVADMPSLARDVRVAILPLRYGSGESTKMLEAAEAGCAVVATHRGVRSLSALAEKAVIAESADDLAKAAVHMLTNERAGAELREIVVQRYARELTLEKLAAVVRRQAA